MLETKTALPVKEGYLTKRGETVKSWKRRWFQLRGGQLYYYKERGVSSATNNYNLSLTSKFPCRMCY
ncbi:hypothetical protein HW132_34625 [Brasilonema sp. CT11]|nr:hypothetical protein [Brasilonema sp. CT11]